MRVPQEWLDRLLRVGVVLTLLLAAYVFMRAK